MVYGWITIQLLIVCTVIWSVPCGKILFLVPLHPCQHLNKSISPKLINRFSHNSTTDVYLFLNFTHFEKPAFHQVNSHSGIFFSFVPLGTIFLSLLPLIFILLLFFLSFYPLSSPSFRGLSPASADQQFLNIARKLELYGIHKFEAMVSQEGTGEKLLCFLR